MGKSIKQDLVLAAMWPVAMAFVWAALPYARQNVPVEQPLLVGLVIGALFLIVTWRSPSSSDAMEQ